MTHLLLQVGGWVFYIRGWIYMIYSLKNLANIIKTSPGFGFIRNGLVEIYNLIHSIPNYNYEPYVRLNEMFLENNNHLVLRTVGTGIHETHIRDIILQCRNNLKNMIQQRLKFTNKTDTLSSNTQTSEYNGNEAYNSAQNTAKGTNQVKTTHFSNTEYQDNEYLKEDITKYIKQFTNYLSDYINVYIIKRRVYKL